MFLSTLGIGEKMMYEWILNSKNGIPHKSNVKRPAKQYDIDRKQYAKSFLERLPKLPSHYCRASSSKVYLEPVFQTISELHREYRKEAQKDESPVISRSLFHNILDELNISLFQPRKDQCDTCCGYEAGNINKVMYDQHIVKKEAARAEKNKDKEAALTKDDMKVISLDLQALLMCPLLKASAMYYKTKLSCHNFTIFDMKTKDVICYFWTEVEVSRLERPYDVKYLSHQFFKKYSDLNYYNSIRPGSKVGDNVVTDIRALMYLPEGEIKYKLAMSGDYLELPRRAKISAPGDTDQLFEERQIAKLSVNPLDKYIERHQLEKHKLKRDKIKIVTHHIGKTIFSESACEDEENDGGLDSNGDTNEDNDEVDSDGDTSSDEDNDIILEKLDSSEISEESNPDEYVPVVPDDKIIRGRRISMQSRFRDYI
ncbi:Hypothetical predicted protein [Mytilus galloprovincialis]|uniref:Uncharacterized protein n=1 Tax=Mytilus galloprovincialis TaxID=29158 RepID=A0A8B6H3R3_MYTGA|nr:Hypothetical predicted protein [Mytilus galloprovincialis]